MEMFIAHQPPIKKNVKSQIHYKNKIFKHTVEL